MPQHIILMAMGGVFILLGITFYIWGKIEEKRYYNSISTRIDVREYLERQPQRPEARALKIGGWIAIAVGMLLLGMAIFWLQK